LQADTYVGVIKGGNPLLELQGGASYQLVELKSILVSFHGQARTLQCPDFLFQKPPVRPPYRQNFHKKIRASRGKQEKS